jgi:hypothetical protein
MDKIEKIKQELKTKYDESLKILELLNVDKENYHKVYINTLQYNQALSDYQYYSNQTLSYYRNDSKEEELRKIIEDYEKENIHEIANEHSKKFSECYLSWFFTVSNCIKYLYPEKYNEFINCYYNISTTEKRSPINYKISNYLNNEQLSKIKTINYYDEYKRINIVYNCFNFQKLIVKAIIDNFDSVSFNYEKETYMTFQEENIDSVQELFDNDFLRAAGALCGVIIEKHLKTKLLPFDKDAFTSKKLTLQPLNEACKTNNIYTTTEFKKIIHLTDLRNLCDHKNTIGPTKEQVQELIDGTKWIIYSI